MVRNHFPLFITCDGRLVVIIGGGRIAERRVKTLLKFNLKLKLIAPKTTDFIRDLIDKGEIEYHERKYIKGDLDGAIFAISVTNDLKVNSEVGLEGYEKNIPVSVCSSAKESGFWFPAVDVSSDAIMGVVGNGREHRFLKTLAGEIRNTISKVRREYEDSNRIEGE